MATQIRAQLLWGAVAGGLGVGGIYYALAGTRTALGGLVRQGHSLEAQVATDQMLKASYEKLQAEWKVQERRLDELSKRLSSEAEVVELPHRIKKMADEAGMDQVAFSLKPERREVYYIEKPMEFEFRAGFPSLGAFISRVSRDERFLTVSNVEISRRADGRSVYSATVKCTISAFVDPAASVEAHPVKGSPIPDTPRGRER